LVFIANSGSQIDETTDTIDFFLADYRFSNDANDYIVQEWTTVDISALGYVSKLEFLLSSSDVGMFGMNTPGFFALDNVVYEKTSTVNISLQVESKVKLYPNPAQNFIMLDNLNEMESVSIEIIDIQGAVVSYIEPILGDLLDISLLAAGVYHVYIKTLSNIEVVKLIKH
jgi:hypothetical protein